VHFVKRLSFETVVRSCELCCVSHSAELNDSALCFDFILTANQPHISSETEENLLNEVYKKTAMLKGRVLEWHKRFSERKKTRL
jgi:hypothetical protein